MPTERVENLLKQCLVWDNHACMPLRPGDHGFLPELERLPRAGIDVVTLNVGFGPQSKAEHLAMLDSFQGWLDARPERYRVARSVADIDAARREGKLAVLFDVEGMAPLDDGDIELVSELRDRGVGWMLVAYNKNNAAGGGCMDKDSGLTGHGRRVLAEMERVGMIACCSHTGYRTARELIDAASRPVIFSHSNALAVHTHARNIPDDLISACAETGGVVGVNGIGEFLGEGTDYPALLLRHIDHMVQLVGPEHVGISLDYCYDRQELIDYLKNMREVFPNMTDIDAAIRMAPPEVIPALAEGMLDLGYGDAAVESILGGNWRRVAAEVWQAAA